MRAVPPLSEPAFAPSRRVVLGALVAGALVGTTGRADAASGPAPAPAAYGKRRPNRIKVKLATNGTDQSHALQAAIDAAPNGAKLRLPSGEYRLDRRIVIRNRANLSITGPKKGSPFVGYTNLTGFDVQDLSHDGRYSYRQHWQIASSRDITLRRITVRGPNTRRLEAFAGYQENVEFEHAFCINAPSTDIRLESCSFSNVNGDGVYVGGIGAPCRNIRLDGITGTHPGRQSLAITNVDGLVARRVNIQGGGRSGVDIEPNALSQYVRNVELRECDMGSRFYPYVIGGRYDEIRRENITLVNCTARSSSSSHAAVLASRNGRNLRIIGHRDMRQGGVYGIVASAWTGVLVQDSQVSAGNHTPTTYGVSLTDCDGTMELVGNVFNGYQYGFDELFEAAGTTNPAGVVHAGNTWAMGAAGD